ncbi:hypothetical protein [Parasitella parasitica]|uniref:GRF-type domain-containing protein n=1 Tax=Parasitella parasitica TaxID=35722 RepID=A0A0B7NVF6_9FUNG|nr:hypothetical protein [Parasitella parasitica]
MPIENCRCGLPPYCLEVKTPGENRGRWYWKCSTGTCRFFKWDNSAMPFIRHPTEAYAAANTLGSLARRPASIPYYYRTPSKEITLTRTTVKVVFSLVSANRITIRAQQNLTIDPLISKIHGVEWDEDRQLWTIPTSMRIYNDAMRALPTDLPNIHLDIEPIPKSLIDLLYPPKPVDDPDVISEVELKWTEFVESPMRPRLNRFQQEGVRLGIERKGRIFMGNENGIGMKEQALALADVYKNEGPVLLTCPGILCSTWKEEIQNFLDLEDEEVCILDNVMSGLFRENHVTTKRKKAAPRKPAKDKEAASLRVRLPYTKRMKMTMENPDYVSSDDESSEEGEQENGPEVADRDEDEVIIRKPIKFYVASHKKISNNRTKIADQRFNVMICDAGHYLKSKDQNLPKNLCSLLKKIPRAIVLSDTAIYSLPIDLYTLIDTIDKDLHKDLELYTQRYCNPKSTVFGWTVNGRSNVEEFNFFMNKKIWYCPRSIEMKSEYSDTIRDKIVVTIKPQDKKEFQTHFMALQSNEHDFDTYLKLTNDAKKDAIMEYIEYVIFTYKRPKIAIAYIDDSTMLAIQETMMKKKIKSVHLKNLQDLEDNVEKYNVSRTEQYVFVDMKLEDINICLSTVDIVVMIDLPKTREKLQDVEAHFEYSNRMTPLTIKYLIAPETMDTYLWPAIMPDDAAVIKAFNNALDDEESILPNEGLSNNDPISLDDEDSAPPADHDLPIDAASPTDSVIICAAYSPYNSSDDEDNLPDEPEPTNVL